MTRDGLTEENLHDGSVKDISHRSRGRPETKEEFVPERERKKAENEDSKSGKGKRLQMEKIRKSSVRQEAVENTVEVTPEEKVSVGPFDFELQALNTTNATSPISLNCLFIIFYCNLNITGTVNFTRTAFPFCLPGSHFGMLFTTRTASLSR